MLGHQFAYSAAPIRKVKEVQFGILSPEEIKAYSVAKIEHPEVMDEATHKPKLGGLMDPRMGTIDRNFKCQTCGEGMSECPGHFGHIELARPVFHPGFIVKVKKILECICVNCGKLKADISDPSFADKIRHVRDPKARMAVVWAHCKTKMTCETDEPKEEGEGAENDEPKKGHGGCGHQQPLVRKEGLKLFVQYKKPKDDDEEVKSLQPDKRLFTPSEVYTTFKKMSDSDLHLIGLSDEYARPEWMILTVMPVPPPPVRPSIAVDGGAMRSEDDLTYKLGDIIKASVNVRRCEQEGAPAHVITEFEQLLQFHVATYMDNDIAGIPQALQKSGRPVKAIRARLKGKEGRLRGNLMGKRVDFSARTVITGDPNLELDEVGVPRSIAMNLTYPERVTPYNIAYLQELVRNGPTAYPGARYVVRDTGERIDLRYNKRADAFLQYGWIVERHLKDGDFVLFNRQPSLHKMSMMSHRVKLMPYSTFRLNLSVTPPYNADFDGDEMNMHVPQSEETRAELSQIAWVPRQIISPQANKPVMGIVQDTLCGIRKFTLRDTFLDWNQVQNILLWVPDWDGNVPIPSIIKPKPLWTGKQILSMVIPRGINIHRAPEPKSSNPVFDDGMLIENGEIVFGIVEKKTVGASQGGLVHVVFREKGPDATRQIFTGIQMVVNFWLFHNGFSIGIGDTIADTKTMSYITQQISSQKVKVAGIIDDATHDRLKAAPGMTIRESFESKVQRELNLARDDCGQYAQKSLKEDNNVKQMVVAGSKGSFINISQMSVCVGQQSVEGRRIPFGFRHRTLPHFTKDDFSPEARGFVENSYLRGLTPQEFFFHAMAGREGLIDTAVKTAETGYIQRRLVKALEDVMVCYDGTVRNSLGDLVQFVYGEDGMDGAFIERQKIDTFALSDKEFEHNYRVDVTDPAGGFLPGVLQVGLDDSSLELQAKLDEEFTQLLEDRGVLRSFIFPRADATTPHYLPVNLQRIVQNAIQIFHIDRRKPSDLEPAYIIESLQQLSNRLVVVRGDDSLSKEAQENASLTFRMHVRATFASRRVLEQFHLNREAFEWVLGEVEAKFNQSLVNPGEMCGTLAAQSIGEPATQMTLNTFHYAGVSSKNVTLGVPRLKEIINVATNIKTPSLSVYLESDIAEEVSGMLAKNVQQELAYTSLRTVTAAVEIWYDPDPSSTIIEEDSVFVESFFAIPDEEIESKLHLQSPWLLRLELDRAKMIDRKLTMSYVAGRIAESFKTDLFVIWSEDNSEKLIIRCRVLGGGDKEDDDGLGSIEEDIFLRQLENTMLNSVSLRGVKDIERVFLLQHDKVYFNDEGSIKSKKEWVLETDGVNLKTVMCIDGVDFRRTYSNSCVEVFNVLGIEAARAAIMKELRGVIEFESSYVNYRHLALLCDLMTHRGTLMAITRHGINRADTGALMRCSFEETVEILMEAAAVGEKDDCHGIAENVMFGQMAPMGTGAFEVALDIDMLKDAIVDHRLPVQNMLAAHADGGMTPGQVAMTPYDTNSPAWSEGNFKGESAAFSPLAVNGGEDPANFSFLGYGQSPVGAGGMSPAGPGYSPSSPNVYSPTSPYVPQSPFGGATSPFGTSPYATSPFYDRARGPTSPTYSPTSPALNLTSPGYSPTSPRYSPTSPSFSPTSPRYSPQSPSFSPTSPRYSPTSPSFSPASPRSPAQMSPSSPKYSPTSPTSPSSPKYSPTSPTYSPASPAYSPASPAYSPTSPQWSPSSPAQNGTANRSHSYSTSPSWD
ncbi:DNA-directed RNA polymerase II, subunit 1 [Serpula lacrymans var. lacrymans S7.9]|uniref:DNA-directed RNA polymerase subunit n=1 Tax=Serpula lacrymans var. lacrymans (strain S7.9) TaxID=578457 RepID=F8PAY6_SERL9|nr:DNA-directed RNA polymerase II, subunit 1 [Serpula lacrymans var. lacrymans S7.9]EGO19737.1 DNA-directed RNA polymerase II, subunit 1 [Serpula lacrymans var. lacrymans S7.9]